MTERGAEQEKTIDLSFRDFALFVKAGGRSFSLDLETVEGEWTEPFRERPELIEPAYQTVNQLILEKALIMHVYQQALTMGFLRGICIAAQEAGIRLVPIVKD